MPLNWGTRGLSGVKSGGRADSGGKPCLGQWPRRNGMIDYLQMAQEPNVAYRRWALTLALNNLFQPKPGAKATGGNCAGDEGRAAVVILDEPTSSLASAEVELVIAR